MTITTLDTCATSHCVTYWNSICISVGHHSPAFVNDKRSVSNWQSFELIDAIWVISVNFLPDQFEIFVKLQNCSFLASSMSQTSDDYSSIRGNLEITALSIVFIRKLARLSKNITVFIELDCSGFLSSNCVNVTIIVDSNSFDTTKVSRPVCFVVEPIVFIWWFG